MYRLRMRLIALALTIQVAATGWAIFIIHHPPHPGHGVI